MIEFKYDEAKDAIVAAHEDNFGRVREYDVTAQVIDVVAESFMAKGLGFAEYCEFDANGTKFRIGVVKGYESERSFVKTGEWIAKGEPSHKCSNCGWVDGNATVKGFQLFPLNEGVKRMEKRTSVKKFERVDLVCEQCGYVVEQTDNAVCSIGGGVSHWLYICPKCHREYRIPFHKHYPYIEAVPEAEALNMTLFRVDFDAKDGTVDTDFVVATSRSQARQQIVEAYGLAKNASVIVEAIESVGGYKIRLVEE